jgi:hypothetical protein
VESICGDFISNGNGWCSIIALPKSSIKTTFWQILLNVGNVIFNSKLIKVNTMRNKFLLLLIFLLFTSPVFAHKVKISEDVGATLHIEPNDNPRAGEPAQAWFALTRKGGKVIPLAECNCQLAVYLEPRKPGETALLNPNLKAIVAEKYQGIPGADIIFPKPGAYLLELNGKPVKTDDFKPFELKFEMTVAAGNSSVNQNPTQKSQVKQDNQKNDNSPFSQTALVAISILVIAGILGVALKWFKRN